MKSTPKRWDLPPFLNGPPSPAVSRGGVDGTRDLWPRRLFVGGPGAARAVEHALPLAAVAP